jgi:hypothetical protein
LIILILILIVAATVKKDVKDRDPCERRLKMGGKLSALDPMQVEVPELKKLLDRDPYLRPYEREFRRR